MPKDVRGAWSSSQGTPVDSGDCRVRFLAAEDEASFAVLADDKVRGSYRSTGLLLQYWALICTKEVMFL